MYKILLCLRYLRSRYIALASIISVTLGVATMIVVNSVMAGFSTEMRDRIHGILADVIIETNSLDGAPDAEKRLAMAEQAAGEYIESMTSTVEVYGMLSFQYMGQWITRPITIIGIEPEEKAKVGPLVDSLASYNPVMEDGVVVTPAIRSRSEKVGWDLTKEQMAQRRERIERDRKFYDQWQQNGNPHNPRETTDDPFSQGSIEEEATIDSAPAEQPENETQVAESDTKTDADTATVDPFNADPFGSTPAESVFPEEPAEEVDPAELLTGRLYVGNGLIEFPYEDRETGKMKMMRMVRPGDDVKISTVSAGRPPEARHFNATIIDVFKSGMSEYDSNLVFCNLEYLQEVRGMIDPQSGKGAITSIQIKLKDYRDADEVVRRLRGVFPPGMFSVRTWEQKQGPLLAAIEVESAILNVLLFMIIAVAGFGILAIFFMIVVEKTRDIGILKALGASSRGIMSIFLSYGLALGIVGSGVGVILGLLFVRYINQIESFLTLITGRPVFDETIYYFPSIPTSVSPVMVWWVAFGAMAIAVLASIFPARRAARLHPVEALRYE